MSEREIEFKYTCLKYTLRAADESKDDLKDTFLSQAAKLDQEIAQIERSPEYLAQFHTNVKFSTTSKKRKRKKK